MKIESKLRSRILKARGRDKYQVTPETTFSGFDAYKKVIDSGVDVVILTSPPNFRPQHLEYAVEKGVHCFFEKPVAVDAPGVRKVIELAKKAKEKNLGFMSGFLLEAPQTKARSIWQNPRWWVGRYSRHVFYLQWRRGMEENSRGGME